MDDKGIYLEKIVEIFEKSINPTATIERDVQLPVINSSEGETTQCDIVITTGIKPRETVTIVEVQNRTRKPERNDVWGWIEKLNQVDAQHLICVSKKGFSKSVKEIARLHSNKIKLIHLKEIDIEAIPLDMFNVYFSYEDFKIEAIQEGEIKIWWVDLDVFGIDEKEIDLGKIKYTDKVFSRENRDKSKLISLADLCSEIVPTLMEDGYGEDRLVIRKENEPLYLFYANVYLEIEIDIKFKWRKTVVDIPVNILAYDQNEYGTLAWLFEGTHDRGDDQINFKVPVTKIEDKYRISQMSIDAPEDVSYSIYGIEKS